MRDLASIQDAFAAALADPGRLPSPVMTSYSSRTPVWRFDVYRNNVYASLTRTLAAKFPVVERLVGQEFFAGMARTFIERSPPRSPVLLGYGDRFPPFLETFEPVSDLPYLPGVAQLEWLVHRAYHAADCVALGVAALAEVSRDTIADLTIELTPSIGVLTSRYPIYAIWRTNTHDAEVVPIGPEAGAESVLVVRPHLDVEILRIPAGTAAFVDALSQGKPLSVAAERANSRDADFRLDVSLATLIRHGAIAGIHLNKSTHTAFEGKRTHDTARSAL